MAEPKVSNTSLGAATMRLIEQYQSEQIRLFNDPVVRDLVGGPIRFLMQFGAMRSLTLQQSDAITKGIYGAQVCRTRYIDDAVRTAIAAGLDQVMLFGAGLDTRPYRLGGMEQVKVYELDLPTVQADKQRKLQHHFGTLPSQVTFVPIDFDSQTLETVLAATPFVRSKPALFIWEGVTQYLQAEAVSRILEFVGKCASGSSIIFTYVLKSIIEHRSDIPNADKMLDQVAKQSPWIFGLEPDQIRPWLETFHLAFVEDVGQPYYQEKYLQSLGRDLEVFAGERIVRATVA